MPKEPTLSASLAQVTILVDDLDAAAAFYSRLLGEPGRRADRRHEFGCGDAFVLSCRARDNGAVAGRSGWGVLRLGFTVDDVAAAFARARTAGCSVIDQHPRERSPGEWGFDVTDPWGNVLTFVARAGRGAVAD